MLIKRLNAAFPHYLLSSQSNDYAGNGLELTQLTVYLLLNIPALPLYAGSICWNKIFCKFIKSIKARVTILKSVK